MRTLAENVQFRDLKKELKNNFNIFREELKTERMADLKEFNWEIILKIQAHGTRLNNAEARIGETETWNMAVKNVLLSLEQQTGMREALKNFERKSRRSIMRIYNVPEDTEEDSFVLEFVDNLLKCKLSLPADTDLQIQRAHRAFFHLIMMMQRLWCRNASYQKSIGGEGDQFPDTSHKDSGLRFPEPP